MDIVRYDQLIPSMITELQSCPRITILQAVRRVGREFFRRTGAWAITLDPFDSVEDQESYTLDLGGLPCEIDSLVEVRANTEAGVTDGIKGHIVKPAYYYLTPPLTLTFKTNAIPSTSVTDGLEVDLILIPNIGSDEVPAQVFNKYADGIRCGALAELMLSAKKPWSDPDAARFNRSQYNRILNQAIADRDKSFKVQGGGLTA